MSVYITFQHKSDMSSEAVADAQKISQDTWTEADAWDRVDQLEEKQIREEIYEKGTFTEIEEKNRAAARVATCRAARVAAMAAARAAAGFITWAEAWKITGETEE